MGGRTGKALKNVAVGAVAQSCAFLLSFLVRTALIIGLGKYYLGLNSVMTSLIAVFNLAELGMTNAVVYSLYRPLACGDKRKVEALLALYKKVYRGMGVAVIAASFAALPFLHELVNTEITVEVYEIYGLFVLSTAVTYFFFMYRAALLQANQEKYLVSCSDLAYAVVSSAGQVFCFLVLGDYIAALVVLVCSQIVRSFLILAFSKRRHPDIDYRSHEKLDKREKRELVRNVYAMAIGKFSDTAGKSVPNVVISAGVGLIESGLYSNYQMITAAIITFLSQVIGSMTASVGSLHIEADVDHKLKVFRRLNFASFLVYAVCCSCVFAGAESFITAWVGEEYVLDTACVLGLCFNLLTIGLVHGTVVFKDGCGIFFQGRYRPLVSCVLTIVLCVVFVGPFGIAGVIWASAISRLLTTNWYDPWLLFKHVFHRSPATYYVRTVLFAAVGIGCMLACGFVCRMLPGDSWLLFAEQILVSCLLTSVLVLLIFARTEQEAYVLGLLKGIFKRKECER